MTRKITPHLWFDKEANEAAEFYVSLFPNSKVTHASTLHDTPSGDCDIVSFTLADQPFMAISAGPLFKFNPSISFFLNFDPSKDKDARKSLDALWAKLSSGGKALMPLDKYPFSQRYGWIQDKFGISWQLILSNPGGEERPFIVPSLMFTQKVVGRAEEAIEYYLTVFKNSKQGMVVRYPKGMEPDREGTLMYSDFALNGQWFAAMDSAHKHDFSFNEAISLLIPCESQDEIDYYWKKLSSVPEAEQCGWCKDKFGVVWQVWPTVIGEMVEKGTAEQVTRLTQAFLQMKKFDIARLKSAYGGRQAG